MISDGSEDLNGLDDRSRVSPTTRMVQMGLTILI